MWNTRVCLGVGLMLCCWTHVVVTHQMIQGVTLSDWVRGDPTSVFGRQCNTCLVPTKAWGMDLPWHSILRQHVCTRLGILVNKCIRWQTGNNYYFKGLGLSWSLMLAWTAASLSEEWLLDESSGPGLWLMIGILIVFLYGGGTGTLPRSTRKSKMVFGRIGQQ